MSTIRPTTIIAATLGTAVAGSLAYAVYFDHKRRHDVEFRKELKRESKRQAKAAKHEVQEAGNKERNELRQLVEEANEDGYPEKAEDKEQYFMTRLSEGESLSANGMIFGVSPLGAKHALEIVTDMGDGTDATRKEAALCLFKALKVYPQPKELMTLYDKTVPKVSPVLEHP